MPAAVPLAIVGSSVIGAAASSSASKKTTQAATQTAQTNNALQQGIYNANTANMQPFMAGGNEAFASIQDFLGLKAGASSPSAQPQTSALAAPGGASQYGTGQQGGSVSYGGRAPVGSLEQRVAAMGDGMVYDGTSPGNALSTGQYGRAEMINEGPAPQAATGNALSPVQGGATIPANALSAFDQFKASTGYQTGLNEGYRGLNTKLAGQGRLGSGDAQREAQRYGQNYAQGFSDKWLDRLFQTATMGAGAANALAGVGTNYANSVGANNNNALNATAAGNAANAEAITGLAGNAGSAAAYYYGNRTPAGASSYGNAASGSGRPIFWG